jgi:hypothetical protein
MSSRTPPLLETSRTRNGCWATAIDPTLGLTAAQAVALNALAVGERRADQKVSPDAEHRTAACVSGDGVTNTEGSQAHGECRASGTAPRPRHKHDAIRFLARGRHRQERPYHHRCLRARTGCIPVIAGCGRVDLDRGAIYDKWQEATHRFRQVRGRMAEADRTAGEARVAPADPSVCCALRAKVAPVIDSGGRAADDATRDPVRKCHLPARGCSQDRAEAYRSPTPCRETGREHASRGAGTKAHGDSGPPGAAHIRAVGHNGCAQLARRVGVAPPRAAYPDLERVPRRVDGDPLQIRVPTHSDAVLSEDPTADGAPHLVAGIGHPHCASITDAIIG